ncbi:MAG: DUF4116 domain-containing protein [Candidatus Comchoanobacterales bacterium]
MKTDTTNLDDRKCFELWQNAFCSDNGTEWLTDADLDIVSSAMGICLYIHQVNSDLKLPNSLASSSKDIFDRIKDIASINNIIRGLKDDDDQIPGFRQRLSKEISLLKEVFQKFMFMRNQELPLFFSENFNVNESSSYEEIQTLVGAFTEYMNSEKLEMINIKHIHDNHWEKMLKGKAYKTNADGNCGMHAIFGDWIGFFGEYKCEEKKIESIKSFVKDLAYDVVKNNPRFKGLAEEIKANINKDNLKSGQFKRIKEQLQQPQESKQSLKQEKNIGGVEESTVNQIEKKSIKSKVKKTKGVVVTKKDETASLRDVASTDDAQEKINDRKTLLGLVSQNGLALQHAGSETFGFLFRKEQPLNNDFEVVNNAVYKNGLALQYASTDLKDNSEIVLVAVEQNGLALQHASEKLKNDREMVLKAVKQNGLALEYAGDDFKNDTQVVIAAIKDQYNAWDFVGDELKSNEKFILSVLSQRPSVWLKLDSSLKDDVDFIKKAVKKNPKVLTFIDTESKYFEEAKRVALYSKDLTRCVMALYKMNEIHRENKILNPKLKWQDEFMGSDGLQRFIIGSALSAGFEGKDKEIDNFTQRVCSPETYNRCIQALGNEDFLPPNVFGEDKIKIQVEDFFKSSSTEKVKTIMEKAGIDFETKVDQLNPSELEKISSIIRREKVLDNYDRDIARSIIFNDRKVITENDNQEIGEDELLDEDYKTFIEDKDHLTPFQRNFIKMVCWQNVSNSFSLWQYNFLNASNKTVSFSPLSNRMKIKRLNDGEISIKIKLGAKFLCFNQHQPVGFKDTSVSDANQMNELNLEIKLSANDFKIVDLDIKDNSQRILDDLRMKGDISAEQSDAFKEVMTLSDYSHGGFDSNAKSGKEGMFFDDGLVGIEGDEKEVNEQLNNDVLNLWKGIKAKMPQLFNPKSWDDLPLRNNESVQDDQDPSLLSTILNMFSHSEEEKKDNKSFPLGSWIQTQMEHFDKKIKNGDPENSSLAIEKMLNLLDQLKEWTAKVKKWTTNVNDKKAEDNDKKAVVKDKKAVVKDKENDDKGFDAGDIIHLLQKISITAQYGQSNADIYDENTLNKMTDFQYLAEETTKSKSKSVHNFEKKAKELFERQQPYNELSEIISNTFTLVQDAKKTPEECAIIISLHSPKGLDINHKNWQGYLDTYKKNVDKIHHQLPDNSESSLKNIFRNTLEELNNLSERHAPEQITEKRKSLH